MCSVETSLHTQTFTQKFFTVSPRREISSKEKVVKQQPNEPKHWLSTLTTSQVSWFKCLRVRVHYKAIESKRLRKVNEERKRLSPYNLIAKSKRLMINDINKRFIIKNYDYYCIFIKNKICTQCFISLNNIELSLMLVLLMFYFHHCLGLHSSCPFAFFLHFRLHKSLLRHDYFERSQVYRLRSVSFTAGASSSATSSIRRVSE